MGIEAVASSTASEVVTQPAIEEIEKQEDQRSFISIMRDLFARNSELVSRLSENSHSNTARLRKDIRKNSKEGAELQAKIGAAAFWTALFGFTCALFMISQRESVKNVSKWIAEQGSRSANDVYTNYTMSKKGPLDAIVSMEQAEYQGAVQPKGTEMKQKLEHLEEMTSSMLQKAAAS